MTINSLGDHADLPAEITEVLNVAQYSTTANFPVELSYSYNTLAATENPNPLYWDQALADKLTGGMTMPSTTLSLWMRPHRWEPGSSDEQVALKVHFDLKDRLELPEAIMSDNSLILFEPVRPGDVISHHQVLRSVSAPKTTKLGTGRFWVIDVEYHNQNGTLVGLESYTGFGYRKRAAPVAGAADRVASTASTPQDCNDTAPAEQPSESEQPAERKAEAVRYQVQARPEGEPLGELHHDVTATTVVLGALASRDWRPMHHDHRFAIERNGTSDIFMNAPNLAAWFERYITDWSGPTGRIGRMVFRIRDSVFPGDHMVIAGTLASQTTDETGCTWSRLEIHLSVADRLCCTCSARVAVATDLSDNPWARRGEAWKP